MPYSREKGASMSRLDCVDQPLVLLASTDDGPPSAPMAGVEDADEECRFAPMGTCAARMEGAMPTFLGPGGLAGNWQCYPALTHQTSPTSQQHECNHGAKHEARDCMMSNATNNVTLPIEQADKQEAHLPAWASS